MQRLLRVEGVTKSFSEAEDERLVLENLDLNVSPGELVLITGSSGSGKSTLLNIVSGIDLPTVGSVYLDDNCITEMGETERAKFRLRNIGFVFQFFNLIPTLTVGENLALPLELLGYNRQQNAQRIEESLAKVELSSRLSTFPDRLSGGEQQRVAIARALIHRPRLVLADEPTGNLDVTTGSKILSLFHELIASSEISVLMVTHSKEAEPFADRILDLVDYRLETRS